MATKTACEAVVEGMGSVWDQCTDPHRHPRFETGQQEAVIAWNAPAAHLPEADPFLRRALRRVLSENSTPPVARRTRLA